MCQISYCHGQNAGYHTSDPHIRHRWKNCNSKSNNQVICESKPSKTTLRKSVMDLIWKISNASLTEPNIFLMVFCVKKWLKISFWLIFFCRNISEWKWQYSEPRWPVLLKMLKDLRTQKGKHLGKWNIFQNKMHTQYKQQSKPSCPTEMMQ